MLDIALREGDPTAGTNDDPVLAGEARRSVQSINDWLLREGRVFFSRPTLLLDGFARKLLEIGIPVERISLSQRRLHPQFAARNLIWNRDAGGTIQVDREYGIQLLPDYLSSPIRRIYEEEVTFIRRRLLDPACPIDFPILRELREKGATDYFVLPVKFLSQRPGAITFTTHAPAGFSECDLQKLEQAVLPLSAALELIQTRETARGLLDVYVGPQAGSHVLSGEIRRGQGETIDAVLFFSDLRSFTSLSNAYPTDEVIGLLNRYFDLLGGPIQQHGGEILKFIGDAVLAIFPVTNGHTDPHRAAERAMTAAQESWHGLTLFNQQMVNAGTPALRAGFSLHRGPVVYGNVGAAARLDFTVIGPAVNLVTRLDELTRALDPPIVVSQAVADLLHHPLRPLPPAHLKGFDDAITAYALPA